jgi:dipeptidyl aminopeptidase/acylaminoacyl peptidase
MVAVPFSPSRSAPAGHLPRGSQEEDAVKSRFTVVSLLAVTGAALTPGAPTRAQAPGYTGHGAGSVSPATLAKYAPPPLPADLTRSIQSMLDVRAPGMGLVAPDGKRLFFAWRVTGNSQVWRLDGPKSFPVQLTGGEDATNVEDVAPDGSFLVVSRDRGGEEYPGLYLLSPDGGPLKVIQHLPRVQTFHEFISDDGRYVYFRANDVKPDSFAIYRVEHKTGTREKIFTEPGLWSVADHRPDGRLLLNKDLGSSINEVYEYTPSTRKLTPLIGQGEREEFSARYGPAEGEVLVLTPKLGEYRRLYRLREGKLNPVTPEIKHDVSDFSIDRPRTRVLYTINQDGYTRLQALDARSGKPLKLPTLPEADHVVSGAFSRTGRYVALGVDTGKAPLVSFVLDWSNSKLTQWQLPSAPEVDLSRFVRAQLESYPARDGTRIPMFVRRPARCPGVCPVAVLFHGGPEGQATPGFSVRAQMFIDAGFTVVEPNVRGSDGYGKTWFHADDGPKRLKIITDIEDCALFIRKSWAKDGLAPRLAIIGGSYGGYSTLIGMTMFAGAYDVGVSVVGPSSLVTFLANTAPYRRAMRASEYGDPEKDREALLKLSPITYIDRVKGPLLLIQGANDPRVPAGETLQMHQALVSRGLKSPLIIFPDEGHGSRKRSNQVLEIGHMLLFLRDNLKPTS